MRLIFYRRVGALYKMIHGVGPDMPAEPTPTAGLGVSALGSTPLGG